MLIGDIVSWGPDRIDVIECKDTTNARSIYSMGGRKARQRQRGSAAAAYLRESSVEDPESTRVVIDAPYPDRQDAVVEETFRAALNGRSLIATHEFASNDLLFVINLKARTPEEGTGHWDRLLNDIFSSQAFRFVAIGFHGDHLRSPSWIAPPVTAFDVSAQCIIAILEGDLFLTRLIDPEIFQCDLSDGTASPFTLIDSTEYPHQNCFLSFDTPETAGGGLLSLRFLRACQ